MTKKHFATVVALSAVLHFTAAAQGTFRNLDFEGATPPFVHSLNGVYSSNAIPGWTPYFGDEPADEVIYNDVTLGGSGVELHDLKSTYSPPLQGTYTLWLQGSYHLTWGAAIGQTGRIPQDAQSLVFYSTLDSDLQVTFGGEPLSKKQVGSSPGCMILAADVSAFSGQLGELRFTAPHDTLALIDNIQFSTVAVPEPSVFGLTAMGGVFAGWWFLRRRR
jgi:hypothetical protein